VKQGGPARGGLGRTQERFFLNYSRLLKDLWKIKYDMSWMQH
jgi:hypothetical protein